MDADRQRLPQRQRLCGHNKAGTFAVENNAVFWAAQVGETQYQTLALAIAAVNGMEGTDPVVITLLDDVTETLYHVDSYPPFGDSGPDNALSILRANVTVDLSDHTLTMISSSGAGYNYLNFFASGGTVKNGSIIAKMQADNYVSYALGAEAANASLTVTDVKTAGGIGAYSSITATIGGDATDIQATGSFAIRADNGAKVIITGGSYRAKETSNGYIFTAGEDSSIEVSGGYFSGKQIFSGEGTLRITGGTFNTDPSEYVDNTCIVKRDGADSYTYTVLEKAGLTAGTYLSDPAGFTASNYKVTDNGDGTWTVYYSAPSGGGSSSGSQTETTTNPDGSTTTTVTRPDGSTTETTKSPDGSKEVVETTKDGTVTTTTTDAHGNKTEVAENPDGTSQTTVTNQDGSSSVTTADETGKAETQVELPDAVVNGAADKGEAVTLPMPAVSAAADAETAPTVTVTLPGSSTSAKVEIPVENVTAGTVAVLVRADGSEEILKTTLPTENGVAVTLSDGDTVKIVDNTQAFDDVADNYWGADEIAFATSRELFNGTGEGTFSPEGDMTRAMIVTVLARYEGVDTDTGGAWYDAGAAWATESGISGGSNLDDSVTREQLVTMLYRYAGEPEASGSITGFADAAQISDWAQEAMLWATETGILNGVSSDMLDPQGTATRAQVAALLMRFIALTA